jgi:hypothetical protein
MAFLSHLPHVYPQKLWITFSDTNRLKKLAMGANLDLQLAIGS